MFTQVREYAQNNGTEFNANFIQILKILLKEEASKDSLFEFLVPFFRLNFKECLMLLDDYSFPPLSLLKPLFRACNPIKSSSSFKSFIPASVHSLHFHANRYLLLVPDPSCFLSFCRKYDLLLSPLLSNTLVSRHPNLSSLYIDLICISDASVLFPNHILLDLLIRNNNNDFADSDSVLQVANRVFLLEISRYSDSLVSIHLMNAFNISKSHNFQMIFPSLVLSYNNHLIQLISWLHDYLLKNSSVIDETYIKHLLIIINQNSSSIIRQLAAKVVSLYDSNVSKTYSSRFLFDFDEKVSSYFINSLALTRSIESSETSLNLEIFLKLPSFYFRKSYFQQSCHSLFGMADLVTLDYKLEKDWIIDLYYSTQVPHLIKKYHIQEYHPNSNEVLFSCIWSCANFFCSSQLKTIFNSSSRTFQVFEHVLNGLIECLSTRNLSRVQ